MKFLTLPLKFLTLQRRRFLKALLSSVVLAASSAPTCTAQARAGGAPLTVFAVGLKGRHGYIDRTGEFVSDKLTWKGKWKK